MRKVWLCSLGTAYLVGWSLSANANANVNSNPCDFDNYSLPTPNLISGNFGSHWTTSGNVTYEEGSAGTKILVEKPSSSTSAKASYVLDPGIFPAIKGQVYTVQVCVKGHPDVPPTLTLEDENAEKPALQRPKALTYLDYNDQWTAYRFIFYLDKRNPVKLTLSTDANKNRIEGRFANPAVVAGKLPAIKVREIAVGENIVDAGWFNSSNNQAAWVEADAQTVQDPKKLGLAPPPGAPADWKVAVLQLQGGLASITSSLHSKTYNLALRPQSEITSGEPYVLTAWVKVEGTLGANQGPHVYIADKANGKPGLASNPNFAGYSTSPEWTQVSYPFTLTNTPQDAKVVLEWYKDAGFSGTARAFITGVSIKQLPHKEGTLSAPPMATQPLIEDFTSYQPGQQLSQSKWLLPNRNIGSSDQVGVLSKNVMFREETEKGKLQRFLSLRFFGGNDSSVAQKRAWYEAGRPDWTDKDHGERQGAAIVTNNYYASGTYVQCVRFPYHKQPNGKLVHDNTGAVSAFWPFHWLTLQPGQEGYNDEPSPIRNSEWDWEIPGSDLNGTVDVSYDLARLNTWGGQWGGEGGNMTSRPQSLSALNGGEPLDNGKWVQIATVWNAGSQESSNGIRTPGYIAWYFNKTCALQNYKFNVNGQTLSLGQLSQLPESVQTQQLTPLLDPTKSESKKILGTQLKLVEVHDGYKTTTATTNAPKKFQGNNHGQDNIPYVASRYWIGIWSPGEAGRPFKTTTNGVDKKWWGWGGTPDFVHAPGKPEYEMPNQAIDPVRLAFLKTWDPTSTHCT